MGFCPIIKGECREDCEFVEDDECLCAEGLRGLRALGYMLGETDSEEVAAIFHFFSVLANAPIYENTKNGSVPWLRVIAKIRD